MKLIEAIETQIESLKNMPECCSEWQDTAHISRVIKALEAAIAEYKRPMLLHDVDGWNRRFVKHVGIEFYSGGVEVSQAMDLFVVIVRDSDNDFAVVDNDITAGQLEVLREVFDHQETHETN